VRWISNFIMANFGHDVRKRTAAVCEALRWYRQIDCKQCFAQLLEDNTSNGLEGVVNPKAVARQAAKFGAWKKEAVKEFKATPQPQGTAASVVGRGTPRHVLTEDEVDTLCCRVRFTFRSVNALRFSLSPFLQKYGYRQVVEALRSNCVNICHHWVATECCATLL